MAMDICVNKRSWKNVPNIRNVFLLFILLSAGCTPLIDPKAPLEQQLSGHPPSEQNAMLRLFCLNEVERITPSIRVPRLHGPTTYEASPEMRVMKNMCEEMATLSKNDGDRAHRLALECDINLTHISEDRLVHPVKEFDINKTREICKYMTDVSD